MLQSPMLLLFAAITPTHAEDAPPIAVSAVVVAWHAEAMRDNDAETGCTTYNAAEVRLTAPADRAGAVLWLYAPADLPAEQVAVWQVAGTAVCFSIAPEALERSAQPGTQLFVGAAQGARRCGAP